MSHDLYFRHYISQINRPAKELVLRVQFRNGNLEVGHNVSAYQLRLDLLAYILDQPFRTLFIIHLKMINGFSNSMKSSGIAKTLGARCSTQSI